jgi:hypothetical protein
MVPVADSDSKGALAIPKPFEGALGSAVNPQNLTPSRRQSLARECEEKIASSLAMSEVVRQWRRMLATAGATEKVKTFDEESMLQEYARHWVGTWNRRELIRSLVFSEGWVATALDSPP